MIGSDRGQCRGHLVDENREQGICGNAIRRSRAQSREKRPLRPANLAWKVDAVLDGADDAVLNSCHDERHPIGTRVLLQSGLMARGVTLHPRVAPGLRNLLLPRLLRIPRVRDVLGRWTGHASAVSPVGTS